jgi:hypothetical protein
MRRMVRWTVVTATALSVAAGAVALAADGPTASLDIKVSPAKGGTKRHPKAVKLDVIVRTNTPAGRARPTITRAVIDFAKGSRFNGGKFAHCSKALLNSRGPGACPKKAKVGSGHVKAFASTVLTKPKVTAFNGPGKNKIELYLKLDSPVRIAQALEGTISKASGPYGLRLTVPVPKSLQVVAGLPVALTYFETDITKAGYLGAVGCPKNHTWPFASVLTTKTGAQLRATTSVHCKKA